MTPYRQYADPKTCSYGSFRTSPSSGVRHSPYLVVDVALQRRFTPYVVLLPIPDTRPLHTGKRRFAYSAAVVHFRKVVYSKKVGSIQNGDAVITLCFYKSDFNFYLLT